MATPAARSLLFVSANGTRVHALAGVASRANWRILPAATAEIAIATLGTHDGLALDAILIDHDDVLALIPEILSRRPALPILVKTEQHSDGLAALRAGGTDYVLKPATNERLLAALDQALATSRLGELRPLSERRLAQLSFAEIVGTDAEFRRGLALAAKGARARVPMLIEGPAGSGKALVAAAIHSASPRDKRPFVVLDAAHISAAQLESELFGHEKGAFPGAFGRQIGKAALADTGTLVIKNVDHVPAALQHKLLYLIDEGEARPMGRATAQIVDVRVIATCQSKLRAASNAGRFREDLYYRLATVHVTLPPLRQRRGDVPMLARHLLARLSAEAGTGPTDISDAALQVLDGYHWPGNVAHLQSTLLRASMARAGNGLTTADFPTLTSLATSLPEPNQLHGNASGVTMFQADGHLRALADIEADIIRLAIGHYRGRMSEVARRLGIGRSTLYRKLIELGLTDAA